MPKHIRSLQELNKDELLGLIDRAIELKEERRAGKMYQQLAGKTIGLIFEKPSTRTRVSFEAAMYGLGGQVFFSPPGTLSWPARSRSRICHG